MRIAHIISSPSGIGGAERVLLELVRAGAEQCWEQRVLNPFTDGSVLSDLCPSGTYAAYSASRWHQVPGARAWVRRELSVFRPEIVHVHLFHALVLVASLPRPRGRRLVLTHHHGSRYVTEKQPLREWVDRVSGRRYDAVVAVSESTRHLLADRYGYPRDKLWTIPNGWSGEPRQRNRSPGHRIICVANFRPQKGHDVLLSAFSVVLKSIPDAELVLVGDGPLRNAIVSQTRELGITSSVRLDGTVSDVWPLLADADVIVLASRYEPLGLAVLEAMAAGLPVVATDVGGLGMLVEPGVSGELVPPGNPDALAETLISLLESPTRLEAMGEASRQRAAVYGARQMVEQYLALYRQLANGSELAAQS